MPLTKLANSAIDGVSGREDDVIGDILNYAGSDLLCYRAKGPHGLIEAQQALWDPVLAWAASALDAPFVRAEGIVHVAQPGASIDRVRAALKGHDPFGLAALHVMTGLTGSALLALAVARGRMTPDEAWKAAHVDEDWQIAQWGEDAEAASRRSARHRDFAAAAHALALLEA
jgi:chaperone required for assembly of F1-ATPase